MSIVEILVIIGVNTLLSILLTFFWRWMLDVRLDRKVTKLEEDCITLQKQVASAKGVAVRTEKKEMEEARMSEAMMMLKDKMDKGGEWNAVLKEVGMQYPDVAIAMGKKMLKEATKIGKKL